MISNFHISTLVKSAPLWVFLILLVLPKLSFGQREINLETTQSQACKGTLITIPFCIGDTNDWPNLNFVGQLSRVRKGDPSFTWFAAADSNIIPVSGEDTCFRVIVEVPDIDTFPEGDYGIRVVHAQVDEQSSPAQIRIENDLDSLVDFDIELISPVQSNYCPSDTIQFGVVPSSLRNVGTNPTFSWALNGQEIDGAVGDTVTLSGWSENDTVQGAVVSSIPCLRNPRDSSNKVGIPVFEDPGLSADIAIDSGTGCADSTTKFCANVTADDPSVTFRYLWTLNGTELNDTSLASSYNDSCITVPGAIAKEDSALKVELIPDLCSEDFIVSSPPFVFENCLSIETLEPPKLVYCAGQEIAVPFDASEPFDSGNVFIARIRSLPSGGFQQLDTLHGRDDDTVFTTLPDDLSTGEYQLEVTATDPIPFKTFPYDSIMVNDLPPAPSVDVTPVCDSGQVTLQASGGPAGSTYNWYDSADATTPLLAGNATFQTPQIDTTTTYYVTTINPAGCESKPKKAVDAVVNESPVAVTDSVTDSICLNDPVLQLSGSPQNGGTGEWVGSSAVSTDGQFDPQTAGVGTHTVCYEFTDSNGCFDSTCKNVEVLSIPNPDAGNDTTLCNADTIIQFIGNPVGGEWSGPSITVDGEFNANSLSAGTYTLVYTFELPNGCSASDSLQVTLSAIPEISFVNTQKPTDCDSSNGQTTVVASPSADYDFSWTGGLGTDSIVDNLDGGVTYQVTVTNTATGCADTRSVSVEDPTPPLVSVSGLPDTVFCRDDAAVTLSGNPTGGTWSGDVVGGNTNVFDPASVSGNTANIIYTVVENGCAGQYNQEITIKPLPTINLGGDTTVCSNAAPFQLTASPSGGTWSGNIASDGLFTPNPGMSDTVEVSYTVTVDGCDATATRKIAVTDAPIAQIQPGGNLNRCATDTVLSIFASSISVAPGNAYRWFRDGNFIGTGTEVMASQSGDYTMEVSNGSGCADTSSAVTVTIFNEPLVEAGNDTTVCSGATFDLGGDPSDGFWSGPGTDAAGQFTAALAGPGTHTLELTAQNGACQATDSKTVTVVGAPQLSSTSTTPTSACGSADGTAEVTMAPGGSYTYQWNDPASQTTQQATGLESGSYCVTVTDVLTGCDTTICSINVNDQAPFSAGFNNIPATVCRGSGNIALNPDVTGGEFTENGNPLSPPIFTPDAAGTFTITYTLTQGGCTKSTSQDIEVKDLNATLGALPDTLCTNDSAITLNVGQPPGGSWSGNGVSGMTFNPTFAGTGSHQICYNVSDGVCSDSACSTITVVPQPTAQIVPSGPITLCPGESDTLQATVGPNLSYTWLLDGATIGGENASTLVPNSSGDYRVVVENAGGCADTSAEVSVTIKPSTAVNAGNDTIFCSNAGIIDLRNTGESPAGGTWSPNRFVDVGSISGNLLVTYTVTDGSCSFNDTKVLSTQPSPQFGISTTNTSGCDDSTGSAKVVFSGGQNPADFDYEWTASAPGFPRTTQEINNLAPGTYNVSVTPNTGSVCSAKTGQASISAPDAPSPNFAIPSTFCQDEAPITLSGNPAGGTFTANGTTLSGNVFNPANFSGAVQVRYTFTDSATNCQGSAEQTVQVNPIPSANAGPDTAVCSNSSLDLMPQFTPQDGGNFNVTCASLPAGFVNSQSCVFTPNAGLENSTVQVVMSVTDLSTSCTNTDTVAIEVLRSPNALDFQANGNTDICEGGTVELEANAGFSSYLWRRNGQSITPPNTGNQITVSEAGDYTVEATNAAGCTRSSPTLTVNVSTNPTIDAGPDTTLCGNAAPIALNPAWNWSGSPCIQGNQLIVTDCAPTAQPDTTIQICATLNSGACFAQDCRNITIQRIVPMETFASNTSSCGATDGTIDVLFPGDPSQRNNHTYDWGPGNIGTNSATISGLASGDYFVDVTNVNTLCTRRLNATINDGGGSAFITDLGGPFCRKDSVITLSATPAGDSSEFSLNSSPLPGNTLNLNDPNIVTGGTNNTITYKTWNFVGADTCLSSATTNFRVFSFPNVQVQADDSLCVSAAPFPLNVIQGNGLWQDGPAYLNSGGMFQPSVAGIGTHPAVYCETGNGGCQTCDTVMITISPEFNVFAGQDTTVFENDPAFSLDGTGESNHPGAESEDWVFGGQTITQFDPQSAGAGNHDVTFQVTENGCTQTDSKEINVLEPVLINMPSQNTLCEFEGTHNFDPEVSVSSPNPVISSTWGSCNPSGNFISSDGVFDIQAALNSGAGPYCIFYQVTVSGRQFRDSVEISILEEPTFSAGPDTTVCAEDNSLDLAARANLPNGSNFSISWSGCGGAVTNSGVFDPGASPSQCIATVEVQEIFGSVSCAFTDEVVITVRPSESVDAGPDRTLCGNDNINFDPLEGAESQGFWSVPDAPAALTNTGNGQFEAANVPNNLSQVMVFYEESGISCGISRDSFQVTLTRPSQPVDAGRDTTIHPDSTDTFVLTGQPSGGTWIGTGITSDGTVDPTQDSSIIEVIYQVDLGGGCVFTDSRDIERSTNIPTPANLVPNNDSACENAASFLVASPEPSGGEWFLVGGGAALKQSGEFDPGVSGPGQFRIRYTINEFGDERDTAFMNLTIFPTPDVKRTTDSIIIGDSVQIGPSPQPGFTYSWDTPAPGLSDTSVAQPIAKPQQTRSYTLTVTSPAGCITTQSFLVEVNTEPDIVVSGAFSPNGDNHNERWYIENIKAYPNASLQVYNRWGSLVFEAPNGYSNANPWLGNDQGGTRLPDGDYYYIIEYDDGSQTETGVVTIAR